MAKTNEFLRAQIQSARGFGEMWKVGGMVHPTFADRFFDLLDGINRACFEGKQKTTQGGVIMVLLEERRRLRAKVVELGGDPEISAADTRSVLEQFRGTMRGGSRGRQRMERWNRGLPEDRDDA